MSNVNASAKSDSAIYFTFDHIGKKIRGSEVSFKKAEIFGTAQYNALMFAMEHHPTYTLFPIPSVKKVAKKQTYKGMNLELMAFHVDNNASEDAKAEFTHMVEEKVAYPTIKSWFLDQFPHFDVAKAQRALAKKDLADKKDAIRKAVKAKRVKAIPAADVPQVVNF